MAKRVNLQNVRLSFPNLFKPSAFEASQTPKYNATFVVRKDDKQVAMLKAAIDEVVKEKWGKVPPGLKVCLRDGAEKAYDGFGPETVFFTASNETRPLVIGRKREPLDQADGVIYAGCYVNASVDLWAQDNQFGKRINASLAGVQFFRNGEAFGGGRPADVSDFVEYEDDDDDFLGNAA